MKPKRYDLPKSMWMIHIEEEHKQMIGFYSLFPGN